MMNKSITLLYLLGHLAANKTEKCFSYNDKDLVLVDNDVCNNENVCDIVMVGEHLRAFASSCVNVPYDPLYNLNTPQNTDIINQVSITATSTYQNCVVGEEISIGQAGPLCVKSIGNPLHTHQHFVGAWISDSLITPSTESYRSSNREYVQVDFQTQIEVKQARYRGVKAFRTGFNDLNDPTTGFSAAKIEAFWATTVEVWCHDGLDVYSVAKNQNEWKKIDDLLVPSDNANDAAQYINIHKF
jgi:hypothetical protein